MRRLFIIFPALLMVLLIIFIAVGSLRAGTGPGSAAGRVQVTQIDPAAYPQITLFVSARDSSGALRSDLTRADFAITEDGQPVDLIDFGGAGGESISTALVIDRSGSMKEEDKIDGAREAATAFVDLLRPGDRAALIAFDSEVDLRQPFTDNQQQLLRSIEQLQPDGGTALYDSVVTGVDLLRDQPGRRVLLVLTDGQDMRDSPDFRDRNYGSEHTLDEAIAYAEAAGQSVYIVGLGDRGSSGDAGIDETVLTRIADGTGGQYFYAPRADELADLYTDLAGAIQNEYRLAYVSPRPYYDGTRRDIQVTVAGIAIASSYTERHLINVSSSPLVGLVLLLPLAGLLIVPVLLRRRPSAIAMPETPRSSAASPPALATATPSLGPGAVIFAPEAATPTIVDRPRHCQSCDAPLRSGARFCSRCGAAQSQNAEEAGAKR